MRVVHVVCCRLRAASTSQSGHSIHGLLIKMLVLIFGMPTVGNDNSLSATGEAEETTKR